MVETGIYLCDRIIFLIFREKHPFRHKRRVPGEQKRTMMNGKDRFRVLGPVDQLPAEGYSPAENSAEKDLLDFYVEALSESEIGFDITERGIDAARPAALGADFQRFDLSRGGDGRVPQFEPGEEAQVDWHEGWIEENGVQRKAQFFCMRLCYSKASFVWL